MQKLSNQDIIGNEQDGINNIAIKMEPTDDSEENNDIYQNNMNCYITWLKRYIKKFLKFEMYTTCFFDPFHSRSKTKLPKLAFIRQITDKCWHFS